MPQMSVDRESDGLTSFVWHRRVFRVIVPVLAFAGCNDEPLMIDGNDAAFDLVSPPRDGSDGTVTNSTDAGADRRDGEALTDAHAGVFDATTVGGGPDALRNLLDATMGFADSSNGTCILRCGSLSCCGDECVDEQNDPNNCGGCGLNCEGSCSSGRCLLVLASGAIGPIAVDDADVYWTSTAVVGTNAYGTIMSVSKSGGVPATVVSGQNQILGIAVDSTSIYFAAGGDGDIMKQSKQGGVPIAIASGQFLDSFAVGETSVYWTNWPDSSVATPGAVRGVPLAGGAFTQLASSSDITGAIAADSTSVYFGTKTGLMSVPLSGGAATTLVSSTNADFVGAIAVDATSVYWMALPPGSNTGNNRVMAVPLGGGGVTTLASGQEGTTYIAVDGASVYWTNENSGTVMKVPVGGGAPLAIASGQRNPQSIAVDDASLYWQNAGAQPTPPTDPAGMGNVMKLTPK